MLKVIRLLCRYNSDKIGVYSNLPIPHKNLYRIEFGIIPSYAASVVS